MDNKILVLGATGKTGSRVTKRLQNKGISVRIGSRKANPAFDWDNAAGWDEVLTGIKKVYLTFQPDLAIPTAADKIRIFTEKARNAGIEKIVLLSGRGEKEAETCENIVINSDIDYTILQCSWFMQNFSEGFFADGILEGRLVLPETTCAEPFVDADDIADVAVKALTDKRYSRQVYELTGPDLLTFRQCCQDISTVIKQPVTFQEMAMNDYTKMLREFEVQEETVWLMQYLFTEVLDGRNASVVNDITKVLGHPATSFADYAWKTNDLGIWKPQLSTL